jgi:hypothetical protein
MGRDVMVWMTSCIEIASSVESLVEGDSQTDNNAISQDNFIFFQNKGITNKLHGLNPRANYTDRANTACRLSKCHILRIEGVAWSAQRIPTAVFSAF